MEHDITTAIYIVTVGVAYSCVLLTRSFLIYLRAFCEIQSYIVTVANIRNHSYIYSMALIMGTQ